MRTTVDLDDSLLKAAKIVAIERGVSLKTLFHLAVQREVEPTRDRTGDPSTTMPIVRSRKPGSVYMTPDDIHAILVREERAAYGTARRR